MKVNTALVFILAGIALWLATQEGNEPVQLRVAQFCSGLVFLIGILTLGEYLLNLDFGIDQRIFKDMHMQPGSFPGRMAFATALSFTLMGAGLIFINSGIREIMPLSQYFVAIPLLISFLAVVGMYTMCRRFPNWNPTPPSL